MVTRGKPAPDLFLHAAKGMGVRPEDCVVVEDSPAGIDAARRAGMRVFAFTGGSHAGQCGAGSGARRRCDPDMMFADMRDPARPRGRAWRAGEPADGAICLRRRCRHGERARRHSRPRRQACSAAPNTRSLMHRPKADHAEHDSEDIWRGGVRTPCAARWQRPAWRRRASPASASTPPARSWCATRDGGQLSVSVTGEQRWDTIVWLDHRALAEADECTATGHRVLDYLGGVMSPEMATPKLMWLKRQLPESWDKAGYFFDLADFLTWTASGSLARSQCTLTCKWTYLAHEDAGLAARFLRHGRPRRHARARTACRRRQARSAPISARSPPRRRPSSA